MKNFRNIMKKTVKVWDTMADRTKKIKPGDKLLKKRQTSEFFHGGRTCRFLSGQVVLFEAGSLFGDKRRCKFFIFKNLVGLES